MNICFVSVGQFNPVMGGIERVSVTLIKQFQLKGHNVISVFLNKDKGNFNSPCQEFQLPDAADILGNTNKDFLNNLFLQFNTEIVLNQSFNHSLIELAFYAKSNLNLKLVYALHVSPGYFVKDLSMDTSITNNLSFFSLLKKRILNSVKYPISYYLRYKYFAKRYSDIYEQYDAFVLLSVHFFDEFSKIANITNRGKLEAISNPSSFSVMPQNSTKKNQIIFVGRMDLQTKRPDRIMEMWSELHEKYPDWSLIMIGDGSDMIEIKEISKKLNLNNITFTGNVDPSTYYLESKILCLTSSHEGFGVVLTEAQQFGCVPIAYESFESLQDIITDGENGFCVPPFKKKLFVQKLQQLMDDEALREFMSKNAIKSCKKFDVNVIANEWINLFKKLH